MNAFLNARRRISIHEVAPRDGFQAEVHFIPTASKIALIDALSTTGIAKIEVTSFTSPRAIPALADAEEVMRSIVRKDGVIYTVLVPNLRGVERALPFAPDEFNVVMSASEQHNLANLRMTRVASLEALRNIAALTHDCGLVLNASLSCAFGCPMEGDIAQAKVLDQVARLVDLGVAGITLCDTTGMAYPAQVESIVDAFTQRWRGTTLTLHFHNTRGMGLANILAAADAGATRFDASLGGLGGCPYAPGATGNVCTEDMVHMLELQGYDTAVDLTTLLHCARSLPALVGHDIPGQIVKAGRRLDRAATGATLQTTQT